MRYFSTKFLINGFVNAIFVSNFIFLSVFENLFVEFISPFLMMFGFFRLLKSQKEIFFAFGFFIGAIWFHWIGFSFRFYDLVALIPFVIIGICLIYAIIFLAIGFVKNLFLRAILLAFVSFIHPFGFNWLNFEILLLGGIFAPNLRAMLAILLCLACVIFCAKFGKMRYFSFLILLFALEFSDAQPKFLPFSVELSQTNINQNIKWDAKFTQQIALNNLALIDKAISQNKDIIVLPENAFSTFLNLDQNLLNILREKSRKITIITGALAHENGVNFNSTYLFYNTHLSRFDKFILVPFSEEIILPNFVKQIINNVFFGGANDFGKAKGVSNYEILGQKITNAICFEATRAEIYANNPDFVIAISNNAWFATKNFPQIEQILQKLIIKYFATKHKTTIYHSANGSKSEIIVPKKLWIKKFLMNF